MQIIPFGACHKREPQKNDLAELKQPYGLLPVLSRETGGIALTAVSETTQP